MILRLVACLVALHGFFLAAGPHLHSRMPAEAGWSMALGGYCASQPGDPRTPLDRLAHHECISCATGGRWLWTGSSSLVGAVTPPQMLATIGASSRPSDALGRPLAGWASSWSSRSPPFFS